jgi:hypothetical protein
MRLAPTTAAARAGEAGARVCAFGREEALCASRGGGTRIRDGAGILSGGFLRGVWI